MSDARSNLLPCSNLLPDDAPRSVFDIAIEWLFYGLLVFSPCAYGAAEPRGELVVLAFAAAISLCLALRIAFRPAFGFVWSWTYLPIGIYLLLAGLQLLPLPANLLHCISPATLTTREDLLADPGHSVLSDPATLTFYPWATVHGLRLVLAVSAVFIAVLNVYRRPGQIKRLLMAVSLVGAAVAAAAVYQNTTSDTTVYGIFGLMPAGHPNSGPFMNHSHFGQFMNLSIGAALALMLIKLDELRLVDGGDFHEALRRINGPRGWWLWALGAFIVVAAATICLSLTRGGMLSLAIGGAVTGSLLAARRGRGGRGSGGRGSLIFVLAILILSALIYFGFDVVYDRLATLKNAPKESGSRWEIVRDLSVAWKRFPLVGTGLGTHEVIFPMFDRTTRAGIATHAENEYAQLIEETGFTGLALCATFLAIVAAHYLRLTWRAGEPIRTAAFGLGFGIVAVLVHSLSDFGQHVPANAVLTAVFFGLLVSIGKRVPSARLAPLSPIQSHSVRTFSSRAAWVLWAPVRVAFVLAIGAGAAWCVHAADVARRAHDAWQSASDLENALAASGWQDGGNDDYTALIHGADLAVKLQPSNISYLYSLGAYRWRAISRVTEPQTGDVVMTQQSLGFARRIVSDLDASFAHCPTYGQTYALAGQIEWFVLSQPAGIRHIHTGYRLAPYDPTVCYAAGALDADQGKWDASREELARTIKLDASFKPQVLELFVKRYDKPDIAQSLAAGDRDALTQLAGLFEAAGRAELAAKCRSDADQILRAAADRPDASPAELESLAEDYENKQNPDRAIEYYERALAGDYGQVDWRLRLARLLGKLGRPEEAMHEARICLRLRPQADEAEKLIGDLSVQPPRH